MGFILLKPTKTPSAHRYFASAAESLALLEERPMGKKAKNDFHCKAPLEYVLSLSGAYFASWNLQASCFVSFVKLPLGPCPSSIAKCFFSPFGKITILLPNQASAERRQHLACISLKTPSAHRPFGSDAVPSALSE